MIKIDVGQPFVLEIESITYKIEVSNIYIGII